MKDDELVEYYFQKYCNDKLPMFKSLESPIVFFLLLRIELVENSHVIKQELNDTCDVLSFNGSVPSMLVCSEEQFVVLKIKYGEYIDSDTMTGDEFLFSLKNIFTNNVYKKHLHNFDPLTSVVWLLRKLV